MSIDTSEMAFPKPTKKAKKSSFGKNKGTNKKEKVKEEVIVFADEVDSMIDFYELHRGDMVSVENYRFTKKLKTLASQWILDVMRSQKCDDVKDVIVAWQSTVLHAAEKVHPSHKVGSFINAFWLLKNDSNYLDVLAGKYTLPFRLTGSSKIGWGDKSEFLNIGDKNGNGTVI